MSSELAIKIRGLGKSYRLGARQKGYSTLRESLTDGVAGALKRSGDFFRGRQLDESGEMIWALRDFDLEIRPGEVVGVIGRNGAGKTTLLKLLARITEPSHGRAEIYGRVGSLLEVGTGFHPELSGRENIYLSSAILGMRKREIDRKLDEIVAFAELEKFIDTPVKRYSSGMYVRLAFSVAAHLEPEILLVDEVLAVGDFAFQSKCLGKLGSLGESGRTVLLVSHNMSAIRRLADRTVWLDGGRLRQDGESAAVVAAYLEAGSEWVRHGERIDLRSHPNRAAGSASALREVAISGAAVRDGMVPMGEDFEIAVRFEHPEPLHNPYVSIAIEDEEGYRLFTVNTRMADGPVPASASAGVFRCQFKGFPLNQGSYYLMLQLQEGQRRVDRIDQACIIQFTPENVLGSGRLAMAGKSVISWPTAWSFEEG
jgi:lipopolysaccharide transport system ATP-binding protein